MSWQTPSALTFGKLCESHGLTVPLSRKQGSGEGSQARDES